ncbi:hypothetical protein KZZ52_27700 [Dactylosporangium sp. AC04546]|uniref:hypothetical protein n=1 Tax=Dactylosporangium sp. AC04546 TaxID=2862460 RepID=UPI001EDE1E32|nr:hypothetical protein [Dactylosporangium sp. AC04546]WVK89052.1 hypothetical protein KZZ52_27700 [Dactylosporangium sp. AC04546]
MLPYHLMIELHWSGLSLDGLAQHLLAYEPAPFDPDPKPPTEGIRQGADTLMSWIKWGALGLIFALGTGGIAVFAGGRLTNNGDWGTRGRNMMGGALVLGILYGAIYEMIKQFTKTP